MSGIKPNPLKLLPHRKTQSQLPILSLSELQKNYFASKQKKKIQHQSSLSNLPILESNHQILIKSPFYERKNCTNKKATCKCQFHKRQKLFGQKFFPFQKKTRTFQQFYLNRLKTLENQPSQLKKEYSHKRVNSSINQTDDIKNKNEELRKLIDQNKEQYIEYLKRIKQKRFGEVDCHNISFQQFLKSNKHWILREIQHKKTVSKIQNNKRDSNHEKNDSIQNFTSNQKGQQYNKKSRHYLRFKTLPSNFQDQSSDDGGSNSDQDDDQGEGKGEDNTNIDKKSRKKSSKLNAEQKKSLRKNRKKTSQNFGSSKGTYSPANKKSKYKFLKTIDTLEPNDRLKLQQFYQKAFQSIGLNYSDFKSQSIQNPHFFQTLCKNLVNPQPKVTQLAKKVLKRISRLPLNLYSTVLKEIKLQLQNINSNDPNFNKQEAQKSLAIAFETIQNEVQDLIKNKQDFKGKQKLLILGKLKNRYVGRGSHNFLKSSELKNKYRSPSSVQSKKSVILPSLNDGKKSRFATQNQGQIPDQQVSQNQNTNLFQNGLNQPEQNLSEHSSTKAEDMILQKERPRQVKKGLKMKKLKKNKNIIKMIDEQIEEQQNSKPIIPKKPNPIFDEEYKKERAASRRKLRDEEYRQHLQFMQKIRERSKEHKQSTASQYQMKRNSVKAHFIRHKKFIQKMELYLVQNSDLKYMVIHQEDNLFTKKRKVRILNEMLNQVLKAQPQSKFYQDLKTYVQIFEKSCDLAVKQKKDKKYKKLAKKNNSEDGLYEEDFRSQQNPNIEFNMEQFIRSINLDNQLKFYKVGHIQMEQEDIDSIVKQFLSRPNQIPKQMPKIQEFIEIENEQIPPQQEKVVDQKLIQIGLDNKSQKIVMEKFYQTQQQCHSQRFSVDESDSRQIKRLKQRFRKNMQKYEKSFNLNRSVN